MDFILSIIVLTFYYISEINWQHDNENYVKPKRCFAFIKKEK